VSLPPSTRLVVRHQDHLFALVYRWFRIGIRLADAVQEAFLSAYRNLQLVPGREREELAWADRP